MACSKMMKDFPIILKNPIPEIFIKLKLMRNQI